MRQTVNSCSATARWSGSTPRLKLCWNGSPRTAGAPWLRIGWEWNSFIISASRPTAKRTSGWRQDAALWKSSSTTSWSGWIPDPMRYLVISDIHANLEAFETVMAEARPLGYDKVLLLGDLVGYGADPNAICERI